jgi:hypothetical protein
MAQQGAKAALALALAALSRSVPASVVQHQQQQQQQHHHQHHQDQQQQDQQQQQQQAEPPFHHFDHHHQQQQQAYSNMTAAEARIAAWADSSRLSTVFSDRDSEAIRSSRGSLADSRLTIGGGYSGDRGSLGMTVGGGCSDYRDSLADSRLTMGGGYSGDQDSLAKSRMAFSEGCSGD